MHIHKSYWADCSQPDTAYNLLVFRNEHVYYILHIYILYTVYVHAFMRCKYQTYTSSNLARWKWICIIRHKGTLCGNICEVCAQPLGCNVYTRFVEYHNSNPETHFIITLWVHTVSLVKIICALILVVRSGHSCALVTTTQLSCHIFIRLGLRAKQTFVKWVLTFQTTYDFWARGGCLGHG